MKQTYAIATREWPDSVWKLADNPVWNIPPGNEDIRGEVTTRCGPWGIISGYRALAIAWDTFDESHYGRYAKTQKVFGVRTLSRVRECGHDLEGVVSIGGKKYRAFTTSVMFERPDGSLTDVAAIHVCMDQPR
jgi:hypothetical protein